LTVERILGANMPLPDDLLEAGLGDAEETILAEELIATYVRRQEEATAWDGLRDAFQPVRALIQGPEALVSEASYETLRQTGATVLSKVSLVRASCPWGFFAIRGTKERAPRWVLLEEKGTLTTELAAVCEGLRERLAGVENRPWSDQAAQVVEVLVARLQAAEREGLPNRRRHALSLMEAVLTTYAQEEGSDRAALARSLLGALRPTAPNEAGVDLYELAQAWLDAIRPVVLQVQERRRRKPFRLKSGALKSALRKHPLSVEMLARLWDGVVPVAPLEHRVAACIVGVPG
jgi:hypothetical protein